MIPDQGLERAKSESFHTLTNSLRYGSKRNPLISTNDLKELQCTVLRPSEGNTQLIHNSTSVETQSLPSHQCFDKEYSVLHDSIQGHENHPEDSISKADDGAGVLLAPKCSSQFFLTKTLILVPSFRKMVTF